jgi:hypothetical protein
MTISSVTVQQWYGDWVVSYDVEVGSPYPCLSIGREWFSYEEDAKTRAAYLSQTYGEAAK